MSFNGAGSVYSVPVLGSQASNATGGGAVSNTAIINQFLTFLTSFRIGESFVYRDRLRANLLRKEYTLELEMTDLIGYDEELAAKLRSEPSDVIPLVSIGSRSSFAEIRLMMC